MNAQNFDWDHLRLVLAIERGGGISGAAKLMHVHHSTVLRRLDSLEQRLGVRLFERGPRGYRTTSDGAELAEMATRIEDDVISAYRQVAGKDLRLSGTIRCATADYVAEMVFPAIYPILHDRYPDIELEIAISPDFASLSKRDADVAIRPTNNPPETLVGREVATLAFGAFASPHYLATADRAAPRWIAPDEMLARGTANRWREQYYPSAQPMTRINSLLAIRDAARAGLGAAFLPRALVESDPQLKPFDSGCDDLKLGLWVLTHPDLRETQRVRAFMSVATEAITAMSERLGGTISTSP